MSAVTDELIRLEAEREVVEGAQKKAEKKYIEQHEYSIGQPVKVKGGHYNIKYLWVRYEEGLPYVFEKYESAPFWDGEDFTTKSPYTDKDTEVEYLKPLSNDERDELEHLNDLHRSEYRRIDSKSEAEELEKKRQELLVRCFHNFTNTSGFMSEYQRMECSNCGWLIDNE